MVGQLSFIGKVIVHRGFGSAILPNLEYNIGFGGCELFNIIWNSIHYYWLKVNKSCLQEGVLEGGK